MARFITVEDFPPLAAAIRLTIVREGHAVESCHSVKAALALDGPFDCAVLDIDLPDGSGVELAEQLRCRNHDIRVVFFTASRDRDALTHAARHGLVVDKAAGCNCLLSAIRQLTQPGTYRRAAVSGAPGLTVTDATNRSGVRRKLETPR